MCVHKTVLMSVVYMYMCVLFFTYLLGGEGGGGECDCVYVCVCVDNIFFIVYECMCMHASVFVCIYVCT